MTPVVATVHSSDLVLVAAVFLASAVEMVEALTIVVAVGVTVGWRTALVGAATAVAVLAVLVAAVGPTLTEVPLWLLRLVVGGLLLIVGLQWLRKAVLRAAGLRARRDEDAVFADQVRRLAAGRDGGVAGAGSDRGGALVAGKGVLLEGLEVVVLVLTLGSASHDVPLAALAAGAAVAVVGGAGVLLARQLSGVPENAMKMAVGLMLVGFGTFWSGEGVHVHWPGSDLALPVLVAAYGLAAWVLTRALGQRPGRQPAAVDRG